MLLYLMLDMENISTKVEGSTNVANFFIRASRNSFLGGVFVLPISNSLCSIVPILLTIVYCDTQQLCTQCFSHTFIYIIVCFHAIKEKRLHLGQTRRSCVQTLHSMLASNKLRKYIQSNREVL